MRYKDGLGYVYDVPNDQVAAFEKKRTVLLSLAIFIKLAIIAGMVIILSQG